MPLTRCLITRYETAAAPHLDGLPPASKSQFGYGERVSAESPTIWEYLIVSPNFGRMTKAQMQWFEDNPLAICAGFQDRFIHERFLGA